MDLVTLSQIANLILQTIFIMVIGLGYYFTVRATQATVEEMRAEHTTGGDRPLITVSEDYANLPNISLIVQNVGQGHLLRVLRSRRKLRWSGIERPALLRAGIDLSGAGAKIGCYWDTLDNLLPLIKEGKIASEITVTVRYNDLNLQSRETVWDINPGRYEGIRNVDYSGMTDLVDVLERKISDNGIEGSKKERGGWRQCRGQSQGVTPGRTSIMIRKRSVWRRPVRGDLLPKRPTGGSREPK